MKSEMIHTRPIPTESYIRPPPLNNSNIDINRTSEKGDNGGVRANFPPEGAATAFRGFHRDRNP